ncbi:MAG: amino acid adenylation domain-containing protein, partial [bacterium]
MTYAALNRSSNRIARSILARRGKREETVALMLEQGSALVAAILGVLKAGKMYVPMDPSYPRARLAALLVDTEASLIITDPTNDSLARALAGDGQTVLNVEDVDGSLSTGNPDISVSPDALAYIFYTSGSTGRPKGVADNHRNVLHNIMRYTNSLHICPEDRLTLLQSCSFSGSVSSLFGALLNGAASLPFDLNKEGSGRLSTWLAQEGITIYHSVPTIFRSFLTSELTFPKVRIIRLEGDRASRVDVELYKRRFSAECLLVIGLGATETGLTRQYFISKDTEVRDGILPIGFPVEGMHALLLDDEGNEVALGAVGEIAIRSMYLAPGYWRNPDLTRHVFLPDPAGGAERIYRTGDMGRMRPDGCLEYHGRKDFQVKVRGHRVDVAEVETALLRLDTV